MHTESDTQTHAPTAETHALAVTFTVENADLNKVLKQLTSIVDHSQVIQVLSFLKCHLTHNTLHVTASNSELEMHATVPVTESTLHDEDASHHFTIPCKKLFEISRSLASSARITFKQERSWTQIQVGRTVFKLAALPVDTFPIMDKQPADVTIQVPENRFLDALKKTQFAMAVNDVRFFLNGLLLQIEKNLTLVATDGHRLSCQHLSDLQGQSGTTSQYILPRKTVQELCKYLQDQEETISLSFNKNHFSFQTESLQLFSNLIDGEYPAYQGLIPKQYQLQATVSCQDLKASLLRLVPLSNEKYHGAKFRFTHNLLHITTQNLHHEEAHDELAITMDSEQDSLEIGFNIHYILDVLQVIDSESISIGMIDGKHSVAFEAVDQDKEGVFIVMPLDI